jgi:hypothetical protein
MYIRVVQSKGYLRKLAGSCFLDHFNSKCSLQMNYYVGFEIVTAVAMQGSVFLDIVPHSPLKGSQDSVVTMATGCGLDDQGVGVRIPVGSRIFSTPSYPDWLWRPPSLLFDGY